MDHEPKHTDTFHFSHIGEPIISELVDLVESEGFDFTPSPDPDDDMMEDLANGLDSEAYGRVAALVTLVEEIEEKVPDPLTAERWRKAALPARLRRKDRKPFTVIGTYDDNAQRWADTIWAKDASHAEELVPGHTDYEITVSGVIEGEVAVA